MEVVEAFKKNELYVPKDYSGLSCQELFVELEEIFSLRKSKELMYEATVEKIRHLFNCNDQLLFVQKIKSYGFCEVDEMMLVLFSHLFVNKMMTILNFTILNSLMIVGVSNHYGRCSLTREPIS